MVLRPKLTGTQEKGSESNPFQQTRYFALFSYTAGAYYPKTYGFNCLLALVILIIYVSWLIRGSKTEQPILKAGLVSHAYHSNQYFLNHEPIADPDANRKTGSKKG